jgi:hypothetical protein
VSSDNKPKPSPKAKPQLALVQKFDLTEIERTLRTFHPTGYFEIRALEVDFKPKKTHWEIFSAEDIPKAVKFAAALSGRSKGVYFTLNPVSPIIDHSAQDADIVKRNWLPIDFDTHRAHPTKKNSTSGSLSDAEKARALECALAVKQYLIEECGWPDLILCDSGNSYHLNAPIDLPNNEASRELVWKVLSGIKRRFASLFADITFDPSVANAGRIWKIHGTMACKGEKSTMEPMANRQIYLRPESIGAGDAGNVGHGSRGESTTTITD